MAAKKVRRSLSTEEEVAQAVEKLLASFGIAGAEALETDASESAFSDERAPKRVADERPVAPSADAEALWGGKKQK